MGQFNDINRSERSPEPSADLGGGASSSGDLDFEIKRLQRRGVIAVLQSGAAAAVGALICLLLGVVVEAVALAAYAVIAVVAAIYLKRMHRQFARHSTSGPSATPGTTL